MAAPASPSAASGSVLASAMYRPTSGSPGAIALSAYAAETRMRPEADSSCRCSKGRHVSVSSSMLRSWGRTPSAAQAWPGSPEDSMATSSRVLASRLLASWICRTPACAVFARRMSVLVGRVVGGGGECFGVPFRDRWVLACAAARRGGDGADGTRRTGVARLGVARAGTGIFVTRSSTRSSRSSSECRRRSCSSCRSSVRHASTPLTTTPMPNTAIHTFMARVYGGRQVA